MTSAGKFVLALVTVPDLKTGRRIARAALKTRLLACATLVPGAESHYWWQGRLETGRELLLLLKTSKLKLPALERLVLHLHPYDTPEFIAFRLDHGTERYLNWLGGSLKG
jgi:periplasmic divalent cation tolerance protein